MLVAVVIFVEGFPQLFGSLRFAHILQLVAYVVELLGMVLVMLQHIGHQRDGLLDALKAAVAVLMAVGMVVVVGVGMLVCGVRIVHFHYLLFRNGHTFSICSLPYRSAEFHLYSDEKS